MVEVEGRLENDLVAGIGDRQDGVHEREIAARGDEDAAPREVESVLGRQLPFERLDELRDRLRRARSDARPGCARNSGMAARASGGGPYATIPCPSEIVPGDWRIHSPTSGMIGACTASMRNDISGL